MTATIQFKSKLRTARNFDGTLAYQYAPIPTLTRSHCDMAAFRKHPRYGGIANSDLFANALAKIKRDLDGNIRLDRIPNNVTVDDSGFLCAVTVEV
jgi:hypothetical protein